MTKDLQQHLLANPHLSHVYLNDNNEWQFFKHPKYPKAVTRDEILNLEISDEPEPAAAEIPAEKLSELEKENAELKKRLEALEAAHKGKEKSPKVKEESKTE